MTLAIQLHITAPGGGHATLTAMSGMVNIVRDTPFIRIEFVNPATGKAPPKVKARRVGQDLELAFEQAGEVVTVTIEDYHDTGGELVGLSDSGDQMLAYLGQDGTTFSSLTDGSAAAFGLPEVAGAGIVDGAATALAGVVGAFAAYHLLRPIRANYNLIMGTPEDDTLPGTARHDRVFAGAGDDFVDGKDGNDTLLGDAGNDTLEGGRGADVLIAGSSTVDHAASGTVNGSADWVSYLHAASGVTVNLFGNDSLGTAIGGDGPDTLFGFENVLGSSHADSVLVSTSAVYNGVIDSGEGNDKGADRANLEAGNDVFVVHSTYLSDTAADTILGGTGYDGILLQGTGLHLDLASANFGATHLTGFEHIDLNNGGHRLSLMAADVLELTGAAGPTLSTLVVNGGATDTVDAMGFGSPAGAGVAVSVDMNGDGSLSAAEQFTTDASGQITGDLGSGMQTYLVYSHASFGVLLVDADIQHAIV